MMPDVPRVLRDTFDRHTPFEAELVMETDPDMTAAVVGTHKEYAAQVLRPGGQQSSCDEGDCRCQDRTVYIVRTGGDRPIEETRRPAVEPEEIK